MTYEQLQQEGAVTPTPTPTPSNCNGVEDDVTPESEAGEFDDPHTQQPLGVVCPPGEDEPADQEMTEFEVVGS